MNLNDYMTVKPLFVCRRKLKHLNIVTFLNYAMSEMEIVLVIEYIDRKNLHELIFNKDKVISRVSSVTNKMNYRAFVTYVCNSILKKGNRDRR